MFWHWFSRFFELAIQFELKYFCKRFRCVFMNGIVKSYAKAMCNVNGAHFIGNNTLTENRSLDHIEIFCFNSFGRIINTMRAKHPKYLHYLIHFELNIFLNVLISNFNMITFLCEHFYITYVHGALFIELLLMNGYLNSHRYRSSIFT